MWRIWALRHERDYQQHVRDVDELKQRLIVSADGRYQWRFRLEPENLSKGQ